MNQTQKSTDSELAYRIKKDSKEAYQELFNRYAPGLYHFALSYLKNKLDAEGLVQEVFLRIWDKRESIDPSQNIKSYIFKIAVNVIYDVMRRKNIENAFHDYVRLRENGGGENTWHTVIYNDMLANLNSLLAQLPKRQRIIFRLSREQGLSNDDIASKLNLSKRTVENQLYRAVAFLKTHLVDGSLIALLFFYIYCR